MTEATDDLARIDDAPSLIHETRPLYWSVRRELWENRYLYIGLLVITAVVLFGSAISVAVSLPKALRDLGTVAGEGRQSLLKPLSVAPAPIMLASLLTGLFYCLDALYGERRDRSILFWKSLPVSDLTTVVAKALIPLVILPAMALLLSIASQAFLLLVSAFVSAASGFSPAQVLGEYGFVEEPLIMIYGLSVHVLWYSPIYAWFLLVSAWTKRAPLMWAVLPLLAVSVFEHIVFQSWQFMNLLQWRMAGAMKLAFADGTHGDISRFSQLEPGRFLTSAGLWGGILFTAASLAAAVRLRRNREPI